MAGLVRVPVGRQLRDLYSRTLAWNCLVSVFSIGFAGMILKIEVRSKALPVVKLTITLSLCITTGIQYVFTGQALWRHGRHWGYAKQGCNWWASRYTNVFHGLKELDLWSDCNAARETRIVRACWTSRTAKHRIWLLLHTVSFDNIFVQIAHSIKIVISCIFLPRLTSSDACASITTFFCSNWSATISQESRALSQSVPWGYLFTVHQWQSHLLLGVESYFWPRKR